MKTLIISGTAKNQNNKVLYNVTLFGQSDNNPTCIYITSFNEELRSFNDLQDVCRNKYASYFNTDLFNIISLENITILK